MTLRNTNKLLIILAMATLPFLVFAGGNKELRFTDLLPDTVNVMVYDTVFLYDTVYEYVEVQETVFIYDTITIYQMPIIGRPDTLFFVPQDSSVLPVQPLMERYDHIWTQPIEESNKKVELRKKNRHRDRWFSLSDESGNNPVPFGYGVRSRNAIEYHGEGLFPNASINSSNNAFADSLISEFYPTLSWRHTLAYHHNFGRVQTSAGLAVSQININNITRENIIHIDTTFPWDYFQREVIISDTTWFLDMDALLQGDTVWVPFVETSTTIVDDSIQVQKIDTSLVQKRLRGETRLLLLEVPIKFYYTLYDGDRLQSTAWGGVSAGLIIQQSGPYYSPQTGELAKPGVMIPATIQLKAMAGIRFDYKVTPVSSIYATFGYAIPLTPLISGSYYDYRLNEISVGLGIKFKLFKNY